MRVIGFPISLTNQPKPNRKAQAMHDAMRQRETDNVNAYRTHQLRFCRILAQLAAHLPD
jgi:hypothetical protein